MKPVKKISLLIHLALFGALTAPAVFAQTDAEPETMQQSIEGVASEFDDFLGDNAGSFVSSLANGEDFSYEMENADGVMQAYTIENTAGAKSPGEISLALGLARQELGDEASYTDIGNFLQGEGGVFAMRASGEGWGQIYEQYGYRVGEVMGDLRANENARAGLDRAEIRGERDRPENLRDRPERREFPERPDRPGRPDLPDRASRPDARPEIPERPVRPNRP